MGCVWIQRLKEEFKLRKLGFSLSRPGILLQPRWNISPCVWLFYRFFMFAYPLGWLVDGSLLFKTPKMLIFLSQISYILLILYYLLAFSNLAAVFMRYRKSWQAKGRESSPDGSSESAVLFHHSFALAVSLFLQWFLHVITGSLALSVSFLYWTINYRHSQHALNGFNISLHICNSIQVLLDLFLSSMPVHLLHYPYILMTGVLYIQFAVFYWLAGGTNLHGQPYIYSELDFGGRPLVATLCCLGVCLICLPFFQFVLWNAQLLRDWLAQRDRLRRFALSREIWWWAGPDPTARADPAESGSQREQMRPMATCSA